MNSIEKNFLLSSESIPRNIYYIPDFINEDEEQYLTNRVNDSSKIKWIYLSNRRLQNWGGVVHPKGLIKEDLPHWLTIYTKKVAELGIFGSKLPNHVLVNEYLPNQGIMPHQDGPAFFPTVATINLGSHTVLNFYPKLEEKELMPDYLSEKYESFNVKSSFSLFLKPRSLLVLQNDAYKNYLHGIEEKAMDIIEDNIVNNNLVGVKKGDKFQRTTRISLTIRYVTRSVNASYLLSKR